MCSRLGSNEGDDCAGVIGRGSDRRGHCVGIASRGLSDSRRGSSVYPWVSAVVGLQWLVGWL